MKTIAFVGLVLSTQTGCATLLVGTLLSPLDIKVDDVWKSSHLDLSGWKELEARQPMHADIELRLIGDRIHCTVRRKYRVLLERRITKQYARRWAGISNR